MGDGVEGLTVGRRASTGWREGRSYGRVFKRSRRTIIIMQEGPHFAVQCDGAGAWDLDCSDVEAEGDIQTET